MQIIQKKKNAIKQKYEKTYQSEIDKLHQMQFEALPEDEKYSGTDSVEELLNKMKKGGAVKCVGNGICENICQFI